MKINRFNIFTIGILLFFAGCVALQKNNYTVDELRRLYSSGNPSLWPKPFLFEEAKEGFVDIGSLPQMTFPTDNPYSDTKSELGEKLFFDPALSESGKISCANCHLPGKTFTDGKKRSLGHNDQVGLRNVLTIINSGYAKSYFWDGKAKSLEDQVKHPIENPLEMNFKMDLALAKIKANKMYRELFQNAFGSEEINEDKVSKAIATYERTIVSSNTKFDEFIQGNSDVFTDDEVNGLHLFRTKANCINCHNTPYFSDQKFHNIGISFFSENETDEGRFEVTKKPEDRYSFKTPTLREVQFTSPYMHNGQFTELRNVLMMYSVGMGTGNETAVQKSTKSKMIKKLELSDEEVFDLVAFLRTLGSTQNADSK